MECGDLGLEVGVAGELSVIEAVIEAVIGAASIR